MSSQGDSRPWEERLPRWAKMAALPFFYSSLVGRVLFSRLVYGPKLHEWPLALELLVEAIQMHSRLLGTMTPRKIQNSKPFQSKAIRDSIVHPIIVEGTRCEWVIHDRGLSSNRVVIYLHGGAYCFLSPPTYRTFNSKLSKSARCRVLAVDYRLAPEHPYPAAVDDAVKVYRWLISPEGGKAKPEDVIIAGDSAGGGLTLATLFRLQKEGLPAPAGAICISPWVDLTCSMESWHANGLTDYLPHTRAKPMALYYAGSEANLTNMEVSPLYADDETLRRLPPVLVQVGDAETLQDEGIAFVKKAMAAGAPVRFEEYENMVHVFQAFGFLPVSKKAIERMSEFIMSRVPLAFPSHTVVHAKSRL